MTPLEYRKYIINRHDYDLVLLDVSSWIQNYLQPMSVRCINRFQYVNHPLVNSGDAFWVNSNTLCTGFVLKSNKTVFVPVFKSNKQYLSNI